MTWTLNRVSLTSGQYRGLLVGGSEAPALEMMLDGAVLGPMSVALIEGTTGQWQVDGDIGRDMLSLGTRTLIIRTGDQVLDTLTVVAGLDAPGDLRAEVDALRAEVSVLKKAFRRHVAESD